MSLTRRSHISCALTPVAYINDSNTLSRNPISAICGQRRPQMRLPDDVDKLKKVMKSDESKMQF